MIISFVVVIASLLVVAAIVERQFLPTVADVNPNALGPAFFVPFEIRRATAFYAAQKYIHLDFFLS